jgi:hypothetical protein
MKCPKCADILPRLAQSCACGWTRPKLGEVDSLPWINCDHNDCKRPAIVRIKDGDRFARLCDEHYDRHFQRKSVENCFAMGINTPEKAREWLRTHQFRIKTFSDIPP